MKKNIRYLILNLTLLYIGLLIQITEPYTWLYNIVRVEDQVNFWYNAFACNFILIFK